MANTFLDHNYSTQLWFTNIGCRSCKTQPFYLPKWVWVKLNNTKTQYTHAQLFVIQYTTKWNYQKTNRRKPQSNVYRVGPVIKNKATPSVSNMTEWWCLVNFILTSFVYFWLFSSSTKHVYRTRFKVQIKMCRSKS